MILHALRIIKTALDYHLKAVANVARSTDDKVVIGNIAFDDSTEYKPKDSESVTDKIVMTLVRVEEEVTLKNSPAFSRNPITNKIEYENPPVFINFYILICQNSKYYENAMTYLSRVVRFFQANKVFTHKNSVVDEQVDPHDRMEQFKMIVDLYSPSFEETNHIWSVLGGKQLPSVIYKVRVMDLKLVQPQEIRGVIEQIDLKSQTAQIEE